VFYSISKKFAYFWDTLCILNNNHRIDWNNTKIIDNETNYNRRLISESIHIKRHTHSINKKTDTDLFPENYLPILDKYKN